MAGIFKVREIAERKRALAEQNDLCRQLLQLELRNLQLYGERVQRKFSRFLMFKSLFTLAAPLAGAMFLRRRSRPNRWLSLGRAVMTGWTLYRKFGPTLRRRFFGDGWARGAAERADSGRG
jgi:glyoxylate carboligase